MKKYLKILLIMGGLLPVIRLFEDGVSSILIFSIFVIVFLWKGLQRVSAKLPLPLSLHFVTLGIFVGGIAQFFVQLEGFEKSFSPDPIVHFFQALTIYLWVTVSWYLILRKHNFSTWSIFWITGIWGVVVEAILIYGSFNVLVWLFIFVVYGSVATIPFLLTREKFMTLSRQKPTLKIYLLSFSALILALMLAKTSIFLMTLVGIK